MKWRDNLKYDQIDLHDAHVYRSAQSDMIRQNTKYNLNRRLRIFGKITAVIIAAIFISAALLVGFGMSDEIQRADVAVVFGNTVNPDGVPSHRLAARLDTAVALYRLGMFKNLIVSGGRGREGFDEATIMKNYLVSRQVPQDKITVDSLGLTTSATAKNAAAIAKANGWSSALVVSQYFHIPRCRLALSQAGFDHVYSAHAHYFELRDIYSTFREIIGYSAYLVGALATAH